MSSDIDCAWCKRIDLNWRIINEGVLSISFISKPCFREGHCLVIPKRHIAEVGDLTKEEGTEIMIELGRLSKLLDSGFGTGIMQKFMPLQTENGVKMDHLHFHAFPRLEKEEGLFPTPYPNNFESFYTPPDSELEKLAKSLTTNH